MQEVETSRIVEIESHTLVCQRYAPYTTTDAYATVVDVDVCGYVGKSIMVKNTGANSLTYKVNGSMDDGTEYDVAILAEAALAPGASVSWTFDSLLTDIKVEAKSTVPATPGILVVKMALSTEYVGPTGT